MAFGSIFGDDGGEIQQESLHLGSVIKRDHKSLYTELGASIKAIREMVTACKY